MLCDRSARLVARVTVTKARLRVQGGRGGGGVTDGAWEEVRYNICQVMKVTGQRWVWIKQEGYYVTS